MATSRSLNDYPKVRRWLTRWRSAWLRMRDGVDIADDADISLSARLVPGVRGAIVVGSQTSVGPLAVLCAQTRGGSVAPITVGQRCFIGGNAVIGPGVSIGDGVIVAGGAVVLRDVAADCIVAGNPARVVRKGINAGRFGRLPPTDPARREQQFEAAIEWLLRKTGR